MQVKRTNPTTTSINLEVSAELAEMQEYKRHVLKRLAKDVKIQGFRGGKAPMHLVEKNVNATALQSEFLDDAINHLYQNAVVHENLRTIGQPKITVMQFVPFDTLVFTVEQDVIGPVTLGDYKKIKKSKPAITITAKDIEEVLKNLQARAAERKEVSRAAKTGDEVVIDFVGNDAKTGDPVSGATGQDYPLILGSDAFIPGFEKELIGLKADNTKDFTIKFPKDYGVAALQSKDVTFGVTIKKVNEISAPELNDAFAKQVSPFKSMAELKDDIKAQLKIERQREIDRAFENELASEIAEKTKVEIPSSLIEQQIEQELTDVKQNLAYRGLTYPEFLEQNQTDDQKYRDEVVKPQAEKRLRVGLTLSEIAEREDISVTQEEIDAQIARLKSEYKDPAMQAELDKPANRRDIAARILTDKTVAKLVQFATK